MGLLDLLLIQPLAFAKFVGQMDYLFNKVFLITAVLRVTLYNDVVITESPTPERRAVACLRTGVVAFLSIRTLCTFNSHVLSKYVASYALILPEIIE